MDYINEALNIEGWTNKHKLIFLKDCIDKVKNIDLPILEIGSAWGRSTAVLAGYSGDKKVYTIDPHTGGINFIKKGVSLDTLDEFNTNIKRLNLFDKIKQFNYGTEYVMSNNMISENFSLVFIDGLHTYEGVKIDIDFIINKLVKGSIVVFDDYFQAFEGYKKGIDEKVSEYGLELLIDDKKELVYFEKV